MCFVAMSRLLTLSAFVMLSCADPSDRFAFDSPEDAALTVHVTGTPEVELEGEIERVIGAASGPDAYIFGVISGIVRDGHGRISVADARTQEVRAYSRAGEHLFLIGREGAGPGEYRIPAYLALRGDDELWVRDAGNSRLVAFRLEGRGASYLRTVRSTTSGAVLPHPIAFDPSGHIVDVGLRADPGAPLVPVRHLLDSLGRSMAVRTISAPPPERVPGYGFSSGWANQRSGFFYLSYGPRHLVTHAPNGDWAEAVSSDYAVRWYDSDGQLRRVIVRVIGPGPALTSAERRAAERSVRDIAERTGLRVPTQVPDHKPVLAALAFDRDGHLWVLRTTASSEPARADVFDAGGRWLASVSWPRGLDIERGSVGRNLILGVITDRLGVQRVGLAPLRAVEPKGPADPDR